MTDTDTTSLPDEKGIRHALKRYFGADGVDGLCVVCCWIVLARDGTGHRDCLRHGMVR